MASCSSTDPTPGRRAPGRAVGAAALAAAIAVALLLAAPAAADEAPPAFYGVVAQQEPGDRDFTTMERGAVGTYRWLVSWPALQQDGGAEPDWTATDRTVANLAEHGIQPLPMVHGSPCFVVNCTKPKPPVANSQPPIGSPQARLAWAGFLRGLVGRYGPEGSFWSENPSLPPQPVRTWQIWNEQNAPQFYRPAPSVEGYAELLRISSQAIRSRDPGARILLGGMFGYPSAPGAIFAADFLDRLYAIPGASSHFDGAALHPYSPDVAGVERQLLQVRRVMNAHGDRSTPIWVTEIGWGTSPTGEGRLVETVDGQAERLTAALGLIAAKRGQLGIAGVMWFSWRDTEGEQSGCDWCPTSGLLEADGSARPAWARYTELTGGAAGDPGDGGGSSPPVLPILGGALVLIAAAAAWLWRRRRSGAQHR